jgi:hypothetical protein
LEAKLNNFRIRLVLLTHFGQTEEKIVESDDRAVAQAMASSFSGMIDLPMTGDLDLRDGSTLYRRTVIKSVTLYEACKTEVKSWAEITF